MLVIAVPCELFEHECIIKYKSLKTLFLRSRFKYYPPFFDDLKTTLVLRKNINKPYNNGTYHNKLLMIAYIKIDCIFHIILKMYAN